jgi:integrase
VQTGQLETTPIAAVRRPSRDETPRQTRLTRHELADWLNTAEQTGGAINAMACLLLLNGLRVSEVCGLDIGRSPPIRPRDGCDAARSAAPCAA